MGDRNNSYQDFLNDLHQKDGDADDCRYGVYDYDYQFNPDGAEATFKSKIFLMSWCPDSSKIKKKMLYSSSFDTLKRGEKPKHDIELTSRKEICCPIGENILNVFSPQGCGHKYL